MQPEVKLKISALDNSQAAFKSVSKSIEGVEAKTKSFNERLQSLQPTFRKMAAVGTIAFAAIGAGVGKMTQDAARAEGSWNKFNTVFADGADDMRDWIGEIRSEMPLATHEIARMAADLQDLLVPMGLARGEAQDLTQGFVGLANKLAAFNDVDPTEILEAFKSGLSGSSEPLRRFGINALDSSIELEALNSGLLKTGQKLMDLDPITRSQVKAQALLTLAVKQSSDAVNGFEVNNDSLIRRQQALQATMAELSVTIGTAFVPVLDSIVKAITPVIEKVAAWIEENPELTRNIIIAAAAIAGLVAVLGLLGMAFAAISAMFILFNPITLIVVGAIAGISAILISLNNVLKMFGTSWAEIWEGIKAVVKRVVDEIIQFFLDPLHTKLQKILSLMSMVGAPIKAAVSFAGDFGQSLGQSVASRLTSVNDAVIAPGGKIISTHPNDWLIATKNPQALGAGNGGGITINIAGTFMDDRAAARRMGDEIMSTLKQQMRLA